MPLPSRNGSHYSESYSHGSGKVHVYTHFTVLMNSLMYRLIWAEVWVPLLLCVGKVPLYFKRLGYTPSEIYAMTYIPASMQLMYDDYTSRLLRSQNLSLTCAILKKKSKKIFNIFFC